MTQVVNLGTFVNRDDGSVSTKFREGDPDPVAPTVPVLGQPIANSPTEVEIPLAQGSTGEAPPITYVLERSLTQTSGYAVVDSGDIFAPDGVYDDTTAAADTEYFYRCKAVDDNGIESIYSPVVNVTTPAVAGDTEAPTVPTSPTLSVVTGESDRLTANWNASTDNVGVTGYIITLGIGDGAGNPVGEGTALDPVVAPPFIITGLNASQQYYIRVKAFDAAGNTSASTARAFQTTPTAPPTGSPIFNDGFESGTILRSGPNSWEDNKGGDFEGGGISAVVQSAGGGSGGSIYYLRTTLIAEPGNYRMEQHVRINGQAFAAVMELDTDYYFGVSIRLPASWVNDELCGDTLFQWHMSKNAAGNQGHYAINVDGSLWSLKRNSEGTAIAGGGPLGSITADKGQWVRWVSKWRFSTTNGLIKVWKNPTAESNTPLVNQSGIVTYNGATSRVKVHLGIYKSPWRTPNFSDNYDPGESPNVSPRFVDHDDCRIGTTFLQVK